MKKTVIIIFIIINIIAINSCSDEKQNDNHAEEDAWPLHVSIIQLIANPAEYHGKKILVEGVVDLSYEGTAVYLCIDNWYYLASKNAIWLKIPLEVIDDELWYYINGRLISEEDAREYNGKYVLIEGTFDMYDTGHRDLFSGGIFDITSFIDTSNINQDIKYS